MPYLTTPILCLQPWCIFYFPLIILIAYFADFVRNPSSKSTFSDIIFYLQNRHTSMHKLGHSRQMICLRNRECRSKICKFENNDLSHLSCRAVIGSETIKTPANRNPPVSRDSSGVDMRSPLDQHAEFPLELVRGFRLLELVTNPILQLAE